MNVRDDRQKRDHNTSDNQFETPEFLSQSCVIKSIDWTDPTVSDLELLTKDLR